MWEENWEDDNVEDDFSVQLRYVNFKGIFLYIHKLLVLQQISHSMSATFWSPEYIYMYHDKNIYVARQV